MRHTHDPEPQAYWDVVDALRAEEGEWDPSWGPEYDPDDHTRGGTDAYTDNLRGGYTT